MFEIEFENGDKYIGNIDDNQNLNGLGKYYFLNNDFYEGNFLNNKFHGKGKITLQNNSIEIVGIFKENKLDFSIICKMTKYINKLEKEVFEGYLDNLFQKTNKGILKKIKNNEILFKYEGNFKFDLFNDFGEFFSENIIYKGNFNLGKMNNFGELKIIDKNNLYFLKAEFFNNLYINNFEGYFENDDKKIFFNGFRSNTDVLFNNLIIKLEDIEIKYYLENNISFELNDLKESINIKGEIDLINFKIIQIKYNFIKEKVKMKTKLENKIHNSNFIIKFLNFLKNDYFKGSLENNFNYFIK